MNRTTAGRARPAAQPRIPTGILLIALLGGSTGCRDDARGSDLSPELALRTRQPAPPDPSTMEVRRLWAGEEFNFYASSPSPDGRHVTEIDWGTGDLALRDLVTGELRHLTDKGTWNESGDYAEVSMFSRDGRRIAFVWFDAETREHEVRVLHVSRDGAGAPVGSAPEVIFRSREQEVHWIYGWSPQEELLVGLFRPDNTTALAMLSLDSGSLRVLRSFDWRETRATLSPDGRYVAYDHAAGLDPRERDIHLLAVEDGRQTTLVEGAGTDRVLGWTPDGESLLFHSDRSGTPSVWRLSMSDGRATGGMQLVRADVRNVEPLGFAGDALYFGVVVDMPAFRTAAIDFERLQIDPLPGVIEPPVPGELRAVAWSPDGEHIVQAVQDPARLRLYETNADGQVVHEWSFELLLQRWLIRWAPDGRSLLLAGIDGRGRDAIFRIHLATGELEPLRYFQYGQTDRAFSVSSDGRTLYYARSRLVNGEPHPDSVEIVEYDIAQRTERVIQDVRHLGPVLVSPDGRSIAYKERGPGAEETIQLFPSTGGEPRILYAVETGTVNALVGWTNDGASLLFVTARNYPDPPLELWRVARSGGAPERIGEVTDWRVDGPALHPDGRTIAQRAGSARGEIWALDLPAATDRRTEAMR